MDELAFSCPQSPSVLEVTFLVEDSGHLRRSPWPSFDFGVIAETGLCCQVVAEMAGAAVTDLVGSDFDCYFKVQANCCLD